MAAPITNPEATQMLYSMYPSSVRHWISRRGGLTPKMIFLRGKELQALYKPCYLDAQASTSKTLRRRPAGVRQQDAGAGPGVRAALKPAIPSA